MIKKDQILNKRYQIISEIGSGGMAKIYEANDLFLYRKVAIKIINLNNENDSLNKERFLQEVKAVTRVRHQNVVSTYDAFIENNYWVLVLELITGKNLKEYLKNKGTLSIIETIEIFNKILLGVAACHKVGIIHRDLKPENILIADNGAIKVLDFGISMIDGYEIKKSSHQVVGTMKYIAPEVVKLQKPTIKSDIYSLGIILYELLIGKTPFYHKNQQLLAVKHIKEEMPLIKEINPFVSESLQTILIKSTKKKPSERYNNIFELQDDLNKCWNETILNKKTFKLKISKNTKYKEKNIFLINKSFLIILDIFILFTVITIISILLIL